MSYAAARDVWVWMDVSGTCNLSCRDCYTKSAHDAVVMSPEAFSAILEKLSHPQVRVRKLHLNWRGEPLINRNLPEILNRKRALLPNTPLEFHTHGMLVTPKLADQIVNAVTDADRIYVSIDGGQPEAHEANRGANTWEGALRGLEHLLDARDRAARDGPTIGIYQISYGRGTSAHPNLVALSRRCDEWTKVGRIEGDGAEESFATPVVPTGPCFWAGNALCITARGEAHVCLLSFRPTGRLGNILEDDLRTILDRSTVFRSQIRELGRNSTQHCRTCRKTEGEVDDPEAIGL